MSDYVGNKLSDLPKIKHFDQLMAFIANQELLKFDNPEDFNPNSYKTYNFTNIKSAPQKYLNDYFDYKGEEYNFWKKVNNKFKFLFMTEIIYVSSDKSYKFKVEFKFKKNLEKVLGLLYLEFPKLITKSITDKTLIENPLQGQINPQYEICVEGEINRYIAYMIALRSNIVKAEGYRDMSLYIKSLVSIRPYDYNISVDLDYLKDGVEFWPKGLNKKIKFNTLYYILDKVDAIHSFTQNPITFYHLIQEDNMYEFCLTSKSSNFIDRNNLRKIVFTYTPPPKEAVELKRKLELKEQEEYGKSKIQRTFSLNGGEEII